MTKTIENGTLLISTEVFTQIAGYAVTNCFGVKGMVSKGTKDSVVRLLKRDSFSKGVKVLDNEDENSIDIELHIAVEHGVNIAALSQSIMSEVRYNVERATGVKVGEVNIFIDSIEASSD